jgi:tetratricopeptide (TPR) repeat protein
LRNYKGANLNEFLSGYRDPLFGLLIFFAIVFIISFFSYWWSVYKSDKKENSIESFLKKFEANKDKNLTATLKDSKDAALFLADIYAKKGEYEKALAILLEINRGKRSLDVLKRVAKIYLKAGFLKKSRLIYEEILAITPRDIEALESLIIIYEKLNDFKEALEIANSLEELKDVTKLKEYLLTKEAIEKRDIKRLLTLPKSRLTIEALFALEPQKGWEAYDDGIFLDIVDILWNLPKNQIKTDTKLLRELYSAKGYIQEANESEIFELDLLLHYKKALLEFEYVCKDCKKIFPFYFSRCPSCQSIEGMGVNMLITKRREVEEDSFV